MEKATVLISTAVALLTITACAGTDHGNTSASREPRRCFWPSDVRNFRAVNATTVNIRAGRDVYRLDLLGSCPNINWNERMGLMTTGSSTICVGSGLGTSVVTRGTAGRGQQRCPVQTITALTPEEVAALPGRERP
ncbi:hypothetical protein EDF56_10295 [Novosphingobium sp. PhB165]|uniref:DUF6491 family protein n=1 Tax=Novosphingobium sp. PhB165 TaxID=2485105 RepID=UPI0010513B88|nr:DUF6491 family protein [Novosphingobium sp. PhB165]TCM20434.1 hypothetical protein EDF56_10295 [Novosphingobium sp. PhB165]